MKLDFKARLVPTGPKGVWAFLHFPLDIEKIFGTRSRVPACGTINGSAFRSSLMPMGGRHVMCINQKMQAGAKMKRGSRTHFVMQRDDKPRTVVVPPALKKAFAARRRAKTVFDKLSFTHRKEYVSWIAGTKPEETVQHRVKKVVATLLAGSKMAKA